MLAFLIILGTLALAFVNGANDVSKGVATLVGSGVAPYRRAVAWGTAWTIAGALAALAVSASLLHTFSTLLVSPAVSQSPLFPLAVAVGACLWVLVATATGLPVSTTHALAGAIVGAALVPSGAGGVHWQLFVTSVALPLALSPLLAATLAWSVHMLFGRRLQDGSRYCVCVEARPTMQLVRDREAAAMQSNIAIPTVVVGNREQCVAETTVGRIRVTDAAHWAASAALSFARGLNDNPKILALAVIAATNSAISMNLLFVLGAGAMGLGSYLSGRRVTETLARKITTIDRIEGLTSSAVASTLVLLASRFALPVSTTHVASGAVMGVGLATGIAAVRWNTVSAIVTAWLITLPMAAIFAALTAFVAARAS